MQRTQSCAVTDTKVITRRCMTAEITERLALSQRRFQQLHAGPKKLHLEC